MKNINDRFDQISTESKQFKEINSELENLEVDEIPLVNEFDGLIDVVIVF
jgi:hypothetical protein